MAMTDDDAYTRSITKNLFNFKHFRASQVVIYLNEKIPVPTLKLNFVDNQYIDG